MSVVCVRVDGGGLGRLERKSVEDEHCHPLVQAPLGPVRPSPKEFTDQRLISQWEKPVDFYEMYAEGEMCGRE